MFKQIWIFVSYLVVCNGISMAQPANIKQIIPPSPEAASITKYGLYPVSQFTGIPRISIPIFNLKAGNVTLPISLDYHASGIKVDDYASWVGLGWILNAGGAITRTVIGVPDDDLVKGLFVNPTIKQKDVVSSFYYYQSFNNITNQDLDSEPDLFSFNFCGHTGKFVFKPNKKALTIEYENLKIELLSDGNFKITDAEGSMYFFEDKVTSSTYTDVSSAKYWPVTGWYLSKIIPVNSTDTIHFTYESVASNGALASYDQVYQLGYLPAVSCSGTCPNCSSPDCTLGIQNIYQTVTSTSYLNTEYRYVKQITAKSGALNFITHYSGLDYAGRILDSIIIQNNNNQTVKRFSLSHDYFFSTAGSNPYAYINDQYRLKLTALNESGTGVGSSPLVHTFNYEESKQLPPRKNYGIDEWGYYNGHEANTTLLTLDASGNQYTFTGYNTSGTLPSQISSTITPGVRTSDETFMKAGMLNKITYPTGGYSQFEFEPNVYVKQESTLGMMDYLAIAKIDDPPNSPYRQRDITFTPGGSFSNARLVLSIPVTNSVNNPYVTFENLTDHTSIQYTTFPTDPINTTFAVTLVPGKQYRITANVSPDPNNPNQDAEKMTVSVRLQWNYPTVTVSQEKGGGMRIKSIADYSDQGVLANTETYKYGENETGVGQMSFFPYLFSTKTYEQDYSYDIILEPCCYTFRNCNDPGKLLHILSRPFYNASDFGGSKIAYPFVSKYETAGTSVNGKTTYHYDFELDDVIETTHPDPLSLVDLSWKSGHLISEKSLKLLSTGEYQPIKEDSLIYTTFYSDTTYGLKVGKKVASNIPLHPDINSYQDCNHSVEGDFYYFEYPIYSAAKKLTKKLQKIYSDNINQLPVITEENYYYDNPQTLLQTRTEAINSKGDTIKGFYKYPHDFSAQVPYGDMVNTRHIWSPVIEQSTYKGYNNFLKSIKANYNYWQNGQWGANTSGSMVVPQSIDVKILGNAPETRVNFNRYDGDGNVLEQQKASDIKNSYVWDYNSVYPIAQVTNASQTDIAYTSFEADGNGNWTIGTGTLSTTGGITGNNYYTLSSGSVIGKTGLSTAKSYLVTYWAKNPLTISGTTATACLTKRNWTFYQHTLPAGSTSVSISGTGIGLDELRLYPTDAQMSTLTYTPLIGRSSACSANSTITYYEYDGLGRLLRIRDMDSNIVKQYDYQYQVLATTRPIWQSNGQLRCKPCPANGNYITSVQQHQEIDINAQSATYNSNHWVDDGIPGSCVINPDWQNTTTPVRCTQSNSQNTGQQEQEQKDMNPCSPTYNQTKWVVTGTNFTSCPTPPAWQSNGQVRCEPCAANSSYTTITQQHQEVDVNINSVSYNTSRWINDGVSTTCVLAQNTHDWQNTATPVRCEQNNSQNTGNQEQERKNLNPCAISYNGTAWFVIGTNLTACPLPSSSITYTSTNSHSLNIHLTNTSTGVVYSFHEPGNRTNLVIGSVPFGTYDVNLSVQGASTYYSINEYSQTATDIDFNVSGVALTTTSTTIVIH